MKDLLLLVQQAEVYNYAADHSLVSFSTSLQNILRIGFKKQLEETLARQLFLGIAILVIKSGNDLRVRLR